jgi:hypothetical protein
MSDLRECPFCSSHPAHNQMFAWCSFNHPLVQLPIELWNRRAPPAPTDGNGHRTFSLDKETIDAIAFCVWITQCKEGLSQEQHNKLNLATRFITEHIQCQNQ